MNKKTHPGDAFAKRHKALEAKKAPKDAPEIPNYQQAFINRFGQEKVDEWKAQYGNRELNVIHFDGKFAALRPVTGEDLGDYMTAIAMNGMSKAVLMLMEQLWIDGDTDLIDNEDCFIAAFTQITQLLEGRKADCFRV